MRQKVCQREAPSVAAACSWLGADLAQHGHDLAHHERQRDEDRGQDHPGGREDDLDPVVDQPAAEPALAAVEQEQREPDHDRRDRERQVDERC